MAHILVVVLIVFLAAVLQGFSGFGFALFSIPCLFVCFDFDLQVAVIFCNATFWFHCLLMSWSVRKQIRILDRIVLAMAVGVIMGVVVARPIFGKNANTPGFVYVFGGLLIVLASAELLQFRKKRPEPQDAVESNLNAFIALTTVGLLVALLFGGMTGVLGLLSGTTGPPLLIYGKFRGWNEAKIRAFVQPVFLFTAIAACVTYFFSTEPSVQSGIRSLTEAMSSDGTYSLRFVSGLLGVAVGGGTCLGWLIRERKKASFKFWFYIIIMFLGCLMICFQAYRSYTNH